MTAFDLLKELTEVRDDYIMASRKRPKRFWTTSKIVALAATAVLVIGLGTAALYLKPWATGPDSTQKTLQNSLEAGDTPSAEPSRLPSASPEAAGKTPLQNVALLAGAQYPEAIAYDNYDDSSEVWTNNQVSDHTVYAMNAFSYETASKVLKDKEESGCFSPLSLYQTLSILASGAEGQTRDELLSLLGQSDIDTLAEESGKLYRVNYRSNDLDRLQISNSLWLDEEDREGIPVEYKQDWVLSAAANYYADVYKADFSDDATGQALGQWVSEHTGGFLHPQELNVSEDTLMSIVNTIWYKAQWVEPFQEEDTAPAVFTTGDGDEVTCDFMHTTTDHYPVIETEEYTKSYLSLSVGRIIFVLPKEGVDIDSLLTEEKLWDVFENGDYGDGEIHWSIPKFETSATYQLSDTLKDLGIPTAFDEETADFSPISATRLYVSSVQQGTHISINEDGVEAAAYTELSLEGAAMEEPQPIVEMNLNRPFLYLITANNGATVFIGAVRNPVE